jgi:hypothetical protein
VRASLRASSSVNHPACAVCSTFTRQKSLGPHDEPRWVGVAGITERVPCRAAVEPGTCLVRWPGVPVVVQGPSGHGRLDCACVAGRTSEPAALDRLLGRSILTPMPIGVPGSGRATDGPDEEVALELIGRAGRAEARGGIATTAFLARACALRQRPGAVCGPGACRRARQVRVGRRSRRRVTARDRASWATGGAGSWPRSSISARRSPSTCGAGATRRRCCSTPPGALSRSTHDSRSTYLEALLAVICDGRPAGERRRRCPSRPSPGGNGSKVLILDDLKNVAPSGGASLVATSRRQRQRGSGRAGLNGAADLHRRLRRFVSARTVARWSLGP